MSRRRAAPSAAKFCRTRNSATPSLTTLHELPDVRGQEIGRRGDRLRRVRRRSRSATGQDPVKVFHDALDNVRPGARGALAPRRRRHLPGAGRGAHRARPGAGDPLADHLRARARAENTMASGCRPSCSTPRTTAARAVKKREDTHRMADANTRVLALPLVTGTPRAGQRSWHALLRSSATATSASWPTSMPARPRRPSASSTTPASPTRSARCTKAPRRWTGWSRSRSAASPSPRPRRPLLARPPHQHHRHAGPRRLHHRGRALAARARRRGRGVRRRSTASSRSPRRCGARPTSTACRASASSTRWTASAPTSPCRSTTISEQLGAKPAGACSCRSASRAQFVGVVDLVRMKAVIWQGRDAGRRVRRRRRSRPISNDAGGGVPRTSWSRPRSSTTTRRCEAYLDGDRADRRRC